MFGNYIDIAIIAYVLIYAISGMRKSVADSLADLLSLVGAIFLSLATYSYAAEFIEGSLQIKRAYADVIGFFLTTSVFKLIIVLALDKLFAAYGDFFKGWDMIIKKAAGAMISALYGSFMILTISTAFLSLSLPAFFQEKMEESRFASFIYKDFFKINDDFRGIFGNVLKTALDDFDFLSVETGSEEATDLQFKVLEVSVDSETEDKMLEMVNQERTSRGLKTLKMDEEARKAARDYGRYLFKNGIFSHTDLEGGGPSDRMKNYEVDYMMLGENLAYAPSLERAHNGLMDSEGHRKNILHPFFGRVGIGVIDGGEEYGMIFVQEFLD